MSRPGDDDLTNASRIRRAVLQLSRRIRPSLLGAGLTPLKLSLVGHLQREGPMTPTELARREGVKLPSLTRSLAELEADGWLVREADSDDGRRTLLVMTASGKRRLGGAASAADRLIAEALRKAGQFREPDVQTVCAILESLCRTMEIDEAET